VLRVARTSAVRSRRLALQLLRMQIISAPEELRDQLRNLTKMQLIRTVAAWRPDTGAYRDPVAATRIALKSMARRFLELNDEVADLDDLIEPLVKALPRRCWSAPASATRTPPNCWSPSATIPSG
jgi:transposase